MNIQESQERSNAGFCWQLTDPRSGNSIHLLGLQNFFQQAPHLSNPRIGEVLQSAKQLVVDDLNLPKERFLEILLEETEKIEQVLSDSFEEHEIDIFHGELMAALKRTELDPLLQELFDDSDDKIGQTCLKGWLALLMQNHFISRGYTSESREAFFQSLSENPLQQLWTEEESAQYFRNNLMLQLRELVRSKAGLGYLHRVLVNPRLVAEAGRIEDVRDRAWGIGDIASYDIASDALDAELWEKEMGDELDHKALEGLMKTMQALQTSRSWKTAERLASLLDSSSGTFAILDSALTSVREPLHERLVELGLQLKRIDNPLKALGLFWKVTHPTNGKVGYLLGTVHYCTREVFELNSEINRCFDQSDALAVEIDVEREDVIQRMKESGPQEFLLNTAGWEELSEEEQAQLLKGLERYLNERVGADIMPGIAQYQGVDRLRVLFTCVLVHLASEYSIESGIEFKLQSRARESGKPIMNLETYEEHFMGGEAPAQIQSSATLLRMLCESSERTDLLHLGLVQMVEHFMGKMIRPWVGGHHEFFEALFKADSRENRRALIQRNQAMVKRIDELFERSDVQSPFCTAGSLHMVGDNGMPKLLSDYDYKVERVLFEEAKH